MKLPKALFAILAVLLLQTMLLDRYPWLQFIDLFLLLNIYYALNFNQMLCLAMSVSSGLIQDSFSEPIMGINAFSKTVIVYLISSMSARLMIKHPLIIMLLISISTSLDLLMIRLLHGIFNLPQPSPSVQVLLIVSVLNGVTGMIGFQVVDRIRLKKEYV